MATEATIQSWLDDAVEQVVERAIGVEASAVRLAQDVFDMSTDYDAGISPTRTEMTEFAQSLTALGRQVRTLHLWAQLVDIRAAIAEEENGRTRGVPYGSA